jgi:hypothetical protein
VCVTGGDSTADVGIRADSMRTGVRISGPRQKQPAVQASTVPANDILIPSNILHLHLSSGNCTA